MTRVVMRTARNQPKPAGAILLDWFPDGGAANTVQERRTPADIGAPSISALDLMRFAVSVYCADKVVDRNDSDDGWTRKLDLRVPISDPDRWGNATALDDAVTYLSGDRWSFEFRAAKHVGVEPADPQVDLVTLFSGGLDSLIGAIDALTDNPDMRLGLVSHNEGVGVMPGVQSRLVAELQARFGDRVVPYNWFIRPAKRSDAQERPLPGARERSTRARSMLFIGVGIVVASAQGPNVELMIPENGFIGINVPLTRARVGSLSTRTTHPFFMNRVGALLGQIGVTNPVTNPYRHQTKGEMVANCSDTDVLRELAPLSVSCAHPEATRWVKLDQGNCGYCYPCLIRRASMHHIGLDVSNEYAYDAMTDQALWARSQRGKDLKAVVASVRKEIEPIDVLRNGPVPGNPSIFVDMWQRGIEELRALLQQKAGGAVSEALGSEE